MDSDLLFKRCWNVCLGNAHGGEYLGDEEYSSAEEILAAGWSVD